MRRKVKKKKIANIYLICKYCDGTGNDFDERLNKLIKCPICKGKGRLKL